MIAAAVGGLGDLEQNSATAAGLELRSDEGGVSDVVGHALPVTFGCCPDRRVLGLGESDGAVDRARVIDLGAACSRAHAVDYTDNRKSLTTATLATTISSDGNVLSFRSKGDPQ